MKIYRTNWLFALKFLAAHPGQGITFRGTLDGDYLLIPDDVNESFASDAEIQELAQNRVPESLRSYAQESLLSLGQWVIGKEQKKRKRP